MCWPTEVKRKLKDITILNVKCITIPRADRASKEEHTHVTHGTAAKSLWGLTLELDGTCSLSKRLGKLFRERIFARRPLEGDYRRS